MKRWSSDHYDEALGCRQRFSFIFVGFSTAKEEAVWVEPALQWGYYTAQWKAVLTVNACHLLPPLHLLKWSILFPFKCYLTLWRDILKTNHCAVSWSLPPPSQRGHMNGVMVWFLRLVWRVVMKYISYFRIPWVTRNHWKSILTFRIVKKTSCLQYLIKKCDEWQENSSFIQTFLKSIPWHLLWSKRQLVLEISKTHTPKVHTMLIWSHSIGTPSSPSSTDGTARCTNNKMERWWREPGAWAIWGRWGRARWGRMTDGGIVLGPSNIFTTASLPGKGEETPSSCWIGDNAVGGVSWPLPSIL
jgi:hypothetical protein